MPQQIISIETSNEMPQVGEQITVDIFHEVQRESDESDAAGASRLSLSLFFDGNELKLEKPVDYPSSSFVNSLPIPAASDDNNDDGIEETNQNLAILFDPASLANPYPDERTKVATATFTVLEGFDGSQIAVEIPQSTSVTYPPETLDPITTTLTVEEPVVEAPVEETPGDIEAETPVEETPGDIEAEAPVEETPGDVEAETPVEETPGDTEAETPVEETPGDVEAETPVEETPGDTEAETPVEETPGDVEAETPVEETPGDTEAEAPVEETPGDTEAEAPVEETPGDTEAEAPVEETPGDIEAEAPMEETPGDVEAEAPMEETPGDVEAEAPMDEAPTVSEPIADMIVEENAENTVIDLSNTFSDIDNDDAAIVKTIALNDNPELINASIDGDVLTLDYLENRSGNAKITIQGESNGKTVTDIFAVNVNPDAAPTVSNGIPDFAVDENAIPTVIDLSNLFTDIDNDDADIVKTIAFNDMPELIDASIRGDELILDYQENSSGKAKITIQGESNGKTVTDVFAIDVMQSVFNGTDEADNIEANDGNNILNGNGGNDLLFGEDGNDTLNGGRGFDRLDGGAGNDILDGGEQISVLTGGEGEDIFVINGQAIDWVIDFELGQDVISFSDDISYDSLEITGTVNSFISHEGEQIAVLLGVDSTELTPGNFSMTIADNNLIGSSMGELLDGSTEADFIKGEAGDDFINGNDGNDLIFGGDGDDILMGGKGFDRLSGGTGDDVLYGGEQISVLNGGSGGDVFVLDDQAVDWVEDFEVGRDKISLDSSINYGSLEITGTVNSFISHEGTQIAVLLGVDSQELTADSFNVRP